MSSCCQNIHSCPEPILDCSVNDNDDEPEKLNNLDLCQGAVNCLGNDSGSLYMDPPNDTHAFNGRHVDLTHDIDI